jgi:catechol 2,3-dioxygenase-like lactoylglutathione lyase family enzyme
MKRLHVHVSVDDLAQSIRFYSTLFAAEPSVLKPDYAKWMLDDPRVNFAISTGSDRAGISHLGIQAEDEEELGEIYGRLARAERPVVEEKGAVCCYARSDKQWVADPQGVPWETFYTHGEATVYGASAALTRLGEAGEGLSTCGCAPAELLRPEPAADACCEPSCCAA